MTKRAPTRSDHLRSAVAEEAARLMAEHGIQDYLVAKRKAAERYGVVDRTFLPKNIEIEAALMSRQRLFGGAQHEAVLRNQRRVALETMKFLAEFEPRLVGPVLTGSATEHAPIQLHVFSDSPEAVYTHLLDGRYEYNVLERRLRMSPEWHVQVPTVRFRVSDDTVEAFIFPRDGIRQAPASAVDGKTMRRADIRQVQQLLAHEHDQGSTPPGPRNRIQGT